MLDKLNKAKEKYEKKAQYFDKIGFDNDGHSLFNELKSADRLKHLFKRDPSVLHGIFGQGDDAYRICRGVIFGFYRTHFYLVKITWF